MKCLCCGIRLNKGNRGESWRLVCRRCEQTALILLIKESPCGHAGCNGNDCVRCLTGQLAAEKVYVIR